MLRLFFCLPAFLTPKSSNGIWLCIYVDQGRRERRADERRDQLAKVSLRRWSQTSSHKKWTGGVLPRPPSSGRDKQKDGRVKKRGDRERERERRIVKENKDTGIFRLALAGRDWGSTSPYPSRTNTPPTLNRWWQTPPFHIVPALFASSSRSRKKQKTNTVFRWSH